MTLDRRTFLRASAGAVALAAGGVLAADAPGKRALKKAVMYATIGYKGGVLEKFQALKAAGFDGVEPMSHMNQDEVVKALEATGLKAAGVCCSTHWAKPLSHSSEKVREESLDGLFQALKDAKRYGAPSVLLVPGRVTKDVTYKEVFDRSIEGVRKAIPLAETLGVKIAVENVWNDFITKPEQAREYLDAVKSDAVGWHLDVGNTGRYNAPETWIPVLGAKLVNLHIKEFDTRAMTPANPAKGFGAKLMEGTNDWPAIMKALDAVGYSGWGISEQPGSQSADAAALKDLADRIDRIYASK
jgi:hexulose-6-phosphate isomerase